MKQKITRLNYKGNNFNINLKLCQGFNKFRGLMFTRREKARALLFEFKKPTNITIHSLFVFFPFVIIWLNSDDKIIDFKIVKPFSFFVSQKRPFSKIIEIPINNKYQKSIKLLVGD